MNPYSDSVLGHATRLFVEGHLRECLAALDYAREELEDDGRAWQLRGLAKFQVGEICEARTSLEHASVLIPLSPIAQCRLTECYLQIRQSEAATAILVHLAELDMLTEYETEFVAEGLLRVGELELGMRFSLAAIRRFRGNARLLFTTSQFMRRLNLEAGEIIPFASLAHRLRPRDLQYRLAYARMLAEADRRREAVEVLTSVDLDEINCVASLQRLKLLYQALDENECCDHCAARLERIHYEVVSGYQPPNQNDL